MSNQIRILFICHGNICRSPMAEFVMKDLVEQKGWGHLFCIESAATHDDAIGRPVHSGTQQVLKAAQISCEGKVARRLRRADTGAWDLFVGMDEANMRNMKHQLGPEAEGRCFKLLEFAQSDRDVADPWYTDNFEATYDDVYAGCTGLLMWLSARNNCLGSKN